MVVEGVGLGMEEFLCVVWVFSIYIVVKLGKVVRWFFIYGRCLFFGVFFILSRIFMYCVKIYGIVVVIVVFFFMVKMIVFLFFVS